MTATCSVKNLSTTREENIRRLRDFGLKKVKNINLMVFKKIHVISDMYITMEPSHILGHNF